MHYKKDLLNWVKHSLNNTNNMAGSISEQTKYVSPDAIQRLVKDVINLNRNPLTEQGIYYEHDSQNMLVGRAMIIGPEDTPYAHGFYFFRFSFPYDYPLSPPQLEYLTNDGRTRFHPNFYRSGKVCLSLLNTWKGEGWTSCQTIRSVLVPLVSILDKMPLLNEPNITERHPDVKIYNKIIHFQNLKVAHIEMLSEGDVGKTVRFPTGFDCFYSTMKSYGLANSNKVLEIIKKKCYASPVTLTTRIYNLRSTINYTRLLNEIHQLYKRLYSIVPE